MQKMSALRSLSQWKCITMAFVCFGCTVLLMTPLAVELLVWIGVGGCGCLTSSNIKQMYTHSLATMYSAANSASVPEDITFLMIFSMLRTAPLMSR